MGRPRKDPYGNDVLAGNRNVGRTRPDLLQQLLDGLGLVGGTHSNCYRLEGHLTFRPGDLHLMQSITVNRTGIAAPWQHGFVSQDIHDDLDSQRAYLTAHNGIRGLEVLDPSEVDRAVRIFRRDGFVVVRDALTADQLAFLKAGVDEAVQAIVALDTDGRGNRGSLRYSFGGFEPHAKHAAPS